ncbi:polysaccharide deacetylase family protein [Prosthecobacter sp. SYSU 5D2]|uniref:polysaccharide deacetylase family protein n=1 Tax=Prosthecobacter sp. SYSU 5D2 TaxID=3134134 RepID=UPI0031FE61CC
MPALARYLIPSQVQAFLAEKVLFQPQALFLHGVEEELIDERIQNLHICLNDFEVLTRYLKRRFCLINLDEYHQRLTAKDGDLGRCVMLTFDDGYQNNHRLAAPILRSLDIPFTLYLTTSSMETGDRLPTFIARAAIFLTEKSQLHIRDQTLPLGNEEERRAAAALITHLFKTRPAAEVREMILVVRELLSPSRWAEVEGIYSSDALMNWDQVADLHRQGVVIGAHGHEHFPLHSLHGRDEISRQIHLSRDAIIRRLGVCNHYAYPNGNAEDICPEAVEILASSGFLTSVTTFPATIAASRHPLLIPRICVYNASRFQKLVLQDTLYRRGRDLQKWQSGMPGQAPGSSANSH